MKIPILILALYLGIQSLPAAATAYQALDYLAAREGTGALQHVFIVCGEKGASPPDRWIIFRRKPGASMFQTRKIYATGTVTRGTATASEVGLPPHAQPLNFSVLNLDSNAARNIAKQQARKENFRFQAVSYQLTTHPLAGVPAWTMRLFNQDRGTMGEVVLSGATGQVLNPLKLYRYQMDAEGDLLTRREPWGYRALRSIGRWFSRTGEAYGHDLRRAAGTTEEILVGTRTRDYSEDAR